ncbi:MAG TPA: sigma-70 family RNA polymerase sigma factor [Candidatus Polarisedimenticolia bacterium]|nr:sigma-70 family RNA polymerase sigma factor [Candidatus Polarisedimenticolia bacterium]
MPADEREILERIRAGEVDAVEALFEEHKTRIYRVCLLHTDSSDDAKDVLQETFLRAFRSVRSFRGDSSFSTWLTRIAINLCLNLRRDRHSPEPMEAERLDAILLQLPNSAPQNPEESLRTRELRERITTLVGRLPPRERMAFVLKHFEQLKIREISEVMSISEGTVKSFLHRAVVTLREGLRQESRKMQP